MNVTVQMSDFDLNSVESYSSFPEISIRARFNICKLAGIESIDVQAIKQQLTEAVAKNVKFKERQIQRTDSKEELSK